MNTKQLGRLERTAFAFRGYNVANLGRSSELLADSRYADVVEKWLRRASQCASDLLKRPVKLVQRVRDGEETTLDTYGDAVALILAMEMAQLELLQRCHQVHAGQAAFFMGYSLGEIAALCAAGVMDLEDALTVPLRLAGDAIELARDVQLGVFFSRGQALDLTRVARLVLEINQEGQGVMGVSSHLSPNSVLLMGQGQTLQEFRRRAQDRFSYRVQLRVNEQLWPPLHTPLVWGRCIHDRAAEMMHAMRGGMTAPNPPVLSLVTGTISYTDINVRELMRRWIDSPQRLWDAVQETLARGIETMIHVGPAPNIIPATFRRLRDNVESQVSGSIRMRALSQIVSRPWLAAILPTRTALLRATIVKHVILEDWLLERET